mmetsp:Transcript_1465/g.3897  ORF Transcript_1465/g.3897 Transcript_1465/m.3897 type:complete len:134 (-) Transcript_1465:578-979(-)
MVLGRTPSHLKAMLRNMVTSLVKHERIKTTLPKAKKLQPLAERVITRSKEDTNHNRRAIKGIVREEVAVEKLFLVMGPRYKERQGGYTRILKLADRRRGDGAEMAIIEYVDREGELRTARPARPQSPPAAANL